VRLPDALVLMAAVVSCLALTALIVFGF